MSSLSNRIALLEGMLKERGVAPPPAIHPPKTRQEAQARQQQEQHQSSGERSESSESKPALTSLNQPPTPPGSGDEDVTMAEPEVPRNYPSSNHTTFTRLIDPLLLQDVEPKKEAGTRHLLCTKGSYVFDQTIGRSRFFGPTANCHVHSKPPSSFALQERPGQAQRAERLITSLGPVTHDHLMRCFWDYYNSWQQVVDEAGFEAGRTAQDPKFYSLFLHVAMLAIGYRAADREREDVKRIAVENRESTLHKEAKAMLQGELERPGATPSVQALLMLADLECGIGRDATGWMYSGTLAAPIAFYTCTDADESKGWRTGWPSISDSTSTRADQKSPSSKDRRGVRPCRHASCSIGNGPSFWVVPPRSRPRMSPSTCCQELLGIPCWTRPSGSWRVQPPSTARCLSCLSSLAR